MLRHAAHKLDVRIRKALICGSKPAPVRSSLRFSAEDGFVRLKDIMELKNFRPYNLEATATEKMTYLSFAAPWDGEGADGLRLLR